ncbi:C-C motif chemokine 26-like [Electrophorus electricus]|uniref:C-C motif chemokine n=1 Tax=Electrophorus electricus TaxID=8005 RepID=A0AAY5F591_ELEEL|nr:C-C motif chemokine 26-like [Electrophorus electricus]
MSAIRLLLLSAVVLLSTVALTEGMRYRTGPRSCCFEFTDKPIKLNNVRSYKRTSQQCNKEAVLFTMKKGLQVCARTTDTWVQQHIKVLQSKMVSGKGPL